MSQAALDILKREHRAISAVLYGLKHTLEEARKGAPARQGVEVMPRAQEVPKAGPDRSRLQRQ